MFFINKLGAWDSVTFFKRRDDNLNISKSSYKPNIGTASSSGYTYADTAKTKINYNYTKENRVTLNTGFVDESFNDVIEQLLMSETIYMVQARSTNRSGSTYEILQGYRWANVVTESLQMQKHINDKTINYVIEFEFNELEQNLVI
jgi:hypothetical protein